MRSIGKAKAVMPRIVDANLLPRELRPAEVSPITVAFAAGLLLAVLSMVPLAYMQHDAKSNSSAISQQAHDAEQSVHDIELAVIRKRSLQTQLDDANAKIAALRTTREQLQGGKRPLGTDVTKVLDPAALPPGARIVSVSGTDHGLRIDGVATGPLDAISYAEKLSHDAGFTSARMVSFAPGSAGGQFTVEVGR